LKTILKLKQILYIKPQSGLYEKQVFKSEVLYISSTTFKIKIPYHRGKIVLLPVGTMVEIEIPGKQAFYSEIIKKTSFGTETCFELVLPYQLIKQKRQKAPRIITITSGKGGVGKSTFLINAAMALSQVGQRVCIVDADLGTANIDVLLNLNARYTLKDIVEGRKNIFETLLEGPNNSIIVPGTSGFQALANITEAEVQKVINSLGLLEPYVDIIFIDTSPGVSNNTMYFNQFADQIVILTTPEPHAITDAYATLKVLTDKKITADLGIVINRAANETEAREISDRIINAARRFLSLNITRLGFVEEDPHVMKSIKRLYPCVLRYPESPASHCYRKIAEKIIKSEPARPVTFLEKLKHILPSS